MLENCIRLVNPAGHIGIVGVYMAPDPGAEDEQGKQGIFPVAMAELFDKSVTVGMGQCPVKLYNEHLRDLIIAGRAKPSHRIRIDEAPEAYQKFDERVDGYTKVVIQFERGSALQ